MTDPNPSTDPASPRFHYPSPPYRSPASRMDGGDGLDRSDKPAEGSYNFYRRYSGGFVNKMLDAIALADHRNKERIRLAFPQLVASFELFYNNNDRDGNCAPEGFPPDPFAVAP